ncbi:MAG: twin-arginine translocation signal domain-containing protein [Verrucomicrobiota bacterium]
MITRRSFLAHAGAGLAGAAGTGILSRPAPPSANRRHPLRRRRSCFVLEPLATSLNKFKLPAGASKC